MDEYRYNETVMDHLPGQDFYEVATGERKVKNRLKKLEEKHPGEVVCLAQNTDGSVLYHVPVSFIQIRKPRQVVLSEERRQELADRMRSFNVTPDDDADDDDEELE